ncbi:hypothetical protein GCM10028784_32280 [Myceligenerans cantabricum]
MQDGSRITRLVEISRSGLEHARPATAGTALDALAEHIADLPDDVLAGMVRTAASLAGWVAGVQARAAGELTRRSQGFTGFEETTTMVSGELRETRRTARVITVRAAAGLHHPAVIDHLSTGRIDAPRADALLLAGRSLTDPQRAEAIERLLPIAPERSAAWLANEMRKLARTLDPGRERKAAAESRAVFHDVCEDEMGTVTAFLPAVDSAAVWGVVDDLAQQLRRTEDTRTLGQLRADVLTSIVTGRLVPEHRDLDDDLDDDHQGERWPTVRLTPTRPVVRVTVPMDALRSLDGRTPPFGRAAATNDAPDADAPGAVAPEVVAPEVDAPQPGSETDLPGGAAQLDGFGPVSAITAARVAFDSDSTWTRLVTDPVTGILLDYSTRAYRPPKALADAVRLRDATCRGPGCQTDARWCDLDHIDPYDARRAPVPGDPGQTRADNLHALCRTHHRLKTRYGWQVHRDSATGITCWTAPTGRHYLKTPTSADPEPTSFKEYVNARLAAPPAPGPCPFDGDDASLRNPDDSHDLDDNQRHERYGSPGEDLPHQGVQGTRPDAPEKPPF